MMEKEYAEYRHLIHNWHYRLSTTGVEDFDTLDRIKGEMLGAEVWDLYGYCCFRLYQNWGIKLKGNEKSQGLLSELENLARKDNKLASAYLILFDAMRDHGLSLDLDSSIAKLDSLREYIKNNEINDNFLQFYILLFHGILSIWNDDVSSAILSFNECVSYQLDELFILYKATAYQWLGVCLIEQGRYEKALEAFNKCLKINKKQENTSNYADVQLSTIAIYREHHAWDIALKTYFEVMEIFLQSKSHINLARTYAGIAHVYSELHDYDKSIEYFIKAVEIFTIHEGPRLAGVLIMLGEVYSRAKRFDQAKETFDNALKLIDNADSANVFMYEYYMAMAEFHHLSSNFTEALDFLSKALEINEKNKLDSNYLAIWKRYSDIYRDMGNTEKAFEYLTKYVELCHNMLDSQKKTNLEILLEKVKVDESKDEMQERLELEKNKAIMAMATTANHEINQPLAIMQLSIEMISRDPEIGEKSLKYLKKLTESIELIKEKLKTYKEQSTFYVDEYMPEGKSIVRFDKK